MNINETTPNEISQDTIPLNNSNKIERDANGRILPGQRALNPKGKPKGARHFSTLIREAIQKVAEGDAEPTDILIVKQLAKKAKEGDLRAMDMVFERVDGKAEQTINLDGELAINEGLTVEDKEKLLSLIK